MTEAAALQLRRIFVNRRPAMLTAFADRLVLADPDGEHVRPLRELARVATRRAFPKPRVVLTFVDGETWEIRGLRQTDATAAHRVIYGLATRSA